MNTIISDELPRLLTGEARPRCRPRRRGAPAHLRRLPAGTGVRRRRARLAHLRPALRAGDRGPWRPAIHQPHRDRAVTTRRQRRLPDLSAVFAQVRREADDGRFRRAARSRPAATPALPRRGRRRRGARRRGRRLSAATTGGGTSAPAARTVALPRSTRARRARRHDRRRPRSTSTRRRCRSCRQALRGLADRQRAHPDAADRLDRQQRHRAAERPERDLMTQYNDIEVSVQDARRRLYNYSGTSVLRGSID